MRIDISFPDFPCQAIDIEFNDELEYVERDLQDKLKMYNVEQNGTEMLYERQRNQRDRERQELEEGIRSKRQCRINGIVNVPKVIFKIINLDPWNYYIHPHGQQRPHLIDRSLHSPEP